MMTTLKAVAGMIMSGKYSNKDDGDAIYRVLSDKVQIKCVKLIDLGVDGDTDLYREYGRITAKRSHLSANQRKAVNEYIEAEKEFREHCARLNDYKIK